MKHQPATQWQGRNDLYDGSLARRWHQQVIIADADKRLNERASFGIVGFACDVGVQRNGGRVGAADGPTALRKQLCNIAWHAGDSTLVDFGDIKVENEDLEAGQVFLAEMVADSLLQVSRLLVVGGGHETALGSFMGLRSALGPEAKIGIINLDAHFDLRLPGLEGGSSGTPFFQIHSLTGADNFHYYCLGICSESNTEGLFQRASDWGVNYRFDRDMIVSAIPQIKRDLSAFAAPLDALFLTVDLDVLPHYQTPGVSAPAARGVELSMVENVIDLVTECAGHCRFGLPLVEITELNPMYDQQGVTARTAAVLACRMLEAI